MLLQVLGVSGVEGEKVITVTGASGKEVTSKPVDFLSSALSQAQIDLDPYQFIEEDEPSSFTKVSQGKTTRRRDGQLSYE